MEGYQKTAGAKIGKVKELPEAAPAGGVREQNQLCQPFIIQYCIAK